jgi:hypothetical protein
LHGIVEILTFSATRKISVPHTGVFSSQLVLRKPQEILTGFLEETHQAEAGHHLPPNLEIQHLHAFLTPSPPPVTSHPTLKSRAYPANTS